jgi:hypothetical protein
MAVKRPNLTDLSVFGIHIDNPEQQCCRCKKSVRGWSEGIFIDELCSDCGEVRVRGRDGKPTRRNRREAMFYRPSSVYAMHPSTYLSKMITIWDGVLLPQKSVTYFTCVVKIDGVLYVGRNRGEYVSLHDRRGGLVRDFGLKISQEHLTRIYAAQQR